MGRTKGASRGGTIADHQKLSQEIRCCIVLLKKPDSFFHELSLRVMIERVLEVPSGSLKTLSGSLVAQSGFPEALNDFPEAPSGCPNAKVATKRPSVAIQRL